ncbi:hypothetical protein SAMN04244560_01719 [Thermoanaerobacter thermohydrosulfuricus]|uniref:Uncharacterized protein n=2 Tax=Thermoanaerobacter thermohydrosulfuricus TaxID=1516 RepID=M8DFM9_THETY|nr:hypothetical protein TthWC1_1633 [Thermoanaerobacter thermohydrosulfuricus WC1]SDG06363.1 hypothetical protein SAMN04244560_01719 [Thermoanaerobacter thermohydrosulfuricus]
MNIVTYHILRKISPEKAREVARKVFEQDNRNVFKTSKIYELSSTFYSLSCIVAKNS